jgi:sortase A
MARSDNRPFALFLVICCLAAGAALIMIERSAGTSTRVVADDPVFRELAAEFPRLTLPAVTAPTSVPATLPAEEPVQRPGRPVSVPRNSYHPEPVRQIGMIDIPKIGLVHPIYEGITLNNIDHGPSHWPGTAMPGEVGNAVFAGHRVTHSHPFLHIDQLEPGDVVVFTIGGVRSIYRVTRHEVVTPSDTWITDQTPTPTATLFACHPPHSARYRYVVRLALVDA